MATRLYQIVRFTNVAGGGGIASLLHQINIDGLALIPDRADRSNGEFDITAVTSTQVTVINNGGAAADCDVWLEYLHTIDRAFGSSSTLFLTPRPFISAGGSAGNTGDAQAFRFTAAGGEGSDFFVTLPVARSTDVYRVQGTLGTVTNILGFNCPDTLVGDRTTTQFRVITTANVTAGDMIDFYVTDNF